LGGGTFLSKTGGKQIYSNPRDVELMRWHQEGHKKEGMIRHLIDARQWINFDAQYREFAKTHGILGLP
jgi:Transposase family tnp2.